MNEEISLGQLVEIGSAQRPKRSDAVANRTLILETAEKLFAAQGVTKVNMAEIAQVAGVGKGTLYRRFANKGELCLALMDTQMLEFQNNMIARMQQLTENQTPHIQQLDQFLDALVNFTNRHVPLLCEVQRERMVQGMRAPQRPHFWQYMTIKGLLKAAVNNHEISEHLDIDYLADALLAPLRADIFRFQKEARGFSLERISAGLRTLVAGLRLL